LVERELALTETIGWQEESLRIKEELLASERMVLGLYRELAAEKEKADDLLLNILPASVAAELKAHGRVEAVQYPCATVLFTDFVNFTRHTELLPPEALVAELNECFSEFDRIATRHSVEKLKTIGDGYMAVAGIKGQCQQHARNAVRAGLEILDFIAQRRAAQLTVGGPAWKIRLGIHSGPVVAGVVGLNKFAYDVWGETVNLAARLEEMSEPGRLTISARTRELIGKAFHCIPRGSLELRHHARIEAFFVEAEAPAMADPAADADSATLR
jgi:class 3 adenylate cyclase